jgi:hypothetical protein
MPRVPARGPAGSGRVFHENDRDIVDVAETDEAGDLGGRIAVDLPGGHSTVVGYEADDVATQATKGGNDLAGPLGLDFEVVAVIADLLDDDRHIEGGIEAGWRVEGFLEQGVDLPGLAVERIAGRLEGGHHAVVVGKVAEQPDGGAQGGDFVGDGEVDDAGLAMYLRPAQFLRGDILTQHRLDDPRPGEAEEGVGGLDEEAALAGQIAATAGVESEHAHDARHHAADLAQCGERLGIAVETADPGRNEGAGAVVHADQGDSLLAGHLEKTRQLAAVGGVDGTGADGEVVAVEGHVAAADVENTGDQGGPVQVLAPVLEQDIGLPVGKDADSLPDGHPLLEMLLLDLVDLDRLDGALRQLVAFMHRRFIAARHTGDLAGDGEFDLLGWLKWIFQ